MADVNLNVNAPAEQALVMAPPTRIDDQLLPRSRWVPVGKRNCYLDVEKDIARYIYLLDKQWFDLTKDTLGDALQITPVNKNNLFSSPLTPDALINFVNNLGYPKVVRTLSAVMTNDMFQSWRALTAIINLCLTGKTLGFERPRAPEYLEKVAKHQRYLASEEGSDPDSPIPKPAKATKKSKPSVPKPAPVTKFTAAQQPKP
nr:hypothetical protein [Tanacetum cinerariifolium]